ncbi:helix-turn-helix transcriptional regulator [Paenibacillus lautus]|uniref:helix-turn-helix transcriptional regulator n=1 Tax=Paenibacillus lautus TaxID=1401 RepID=UPI001C10FE3E|nr:AraC family transcriptional regulator [Paenibacillus lautus]
MSFILSGNWKQTVRATGTISKVTIHPSIRKALLFIQHHFREPLSLASAADDAGLSANYFSECFRRQIGISFRIT